MRSALLVAVLWISGCFVPLREDSASPVVRYYAYSWQICSAVLVDATHAYTAEHCIPASLDGVALRRGLDEEYPVRSVETFEEDKDIAYLTLAEPMPGPYAEIGSLPNYGEEVLLSGYGCGSDNPLLPGPLGKRSGVYRGTSPSGDLVGKGEVCDGDSGGALLSEDGRLIGILWGRAPGWWHATQLPEYAE